MKNTSLLTVEILKESVALTIPEGVREATKSLLLNVLFDIPPDISHTVAFGITTPKHYRAVVVAVRNGIQDVKLRKFARKLDEAFANGAAMTALVKRYAPEYAIEFRPLLDIAEDPKP